MTSPTPQTTQAQPPNDATTQKVVAVLAAGYAVDKTAHLLAGVLSPLGITTTAVVAALQLAGDGTAHKPNARLAGHGLASGVKLRGVRQQELAFRAAYIVNAARRIQADLRSGKSLRDALAAERVNFERHESARKGRLDAAAQVQRSANEFGPLLGWYLNPLLNNEPECEAANGHNFYADEGTIIGYPGSVHPNCGCVAGPPHPGARLVDEAVGFAHASLAFETHSDIELARYRAKFTAREADYLEGLADEAEGLLDDDRLLDMWAAAQS